MAVTASAFLAFQELGLPRGEVRALSQPCGPVRPIAVEGTSHVFDFDVPGYFLVSVLRQMGMYRICPMLGNRLGMSVTVNFGKHFPVHQVVHLFETFPRYHRAIVVSPPYYLGHQA